MGSGQTEADIFYQYTTKFKSSNILGLTNIFLSVLINCVTVQYQRQGTCIFMVLCFPEKLTK